ncbi:AP-4 complex subunit epsilon-1-like [Ptychodera flava]|uniref:AP-4 complex subunit epsilon-1-like n=1 Tax=Ptychodera flava TaxID=63121 RepID=UPI00396A6876
MSDIMEKTLASLPGFLTGNYGTRGANISAGFQNLIRCVGEAKSKHEEERIIKKELELLKQRLAHPDISKKQMREYLVRLIYCEMLGQDASFGYIHALKFAQQGTLLDKRVGYLAVSLFLHENHELVVLLINTLQRDLRSTNIVEVCIALTAVSRLINTEMIAAILPLVEDKLQHTKAIVRIKAVMTLQQFHKKAPNVVQHIHGKFQKALCDKDPGVMSAALYIFHDLIKKDTAKYKDLVPPFITVLQQIIDKKLPTDYEYHQIPAPWLQIRIIKMLAKLGQDDAVNSSLMYKTLENTLIRADQHHCMSYAILYECIMTICQISPNAALVAKAAACVGRLLKARSNNLRYFGLNALSAVIKVNATYAAEHQLIVIECLDDPDDTIKFKTLDLLYRMTNQKNVEVICEKLTEHLKSAKDIYIKKDLVSKITTLAERFSPRAEWYLNTINQVFLLAGAIVPKEVANNLMKLIAEDTAAEEYDRELRINAVMCYNSLMDRPLLPDSLIHVICWVLGEFSHLAESLSPNEIVNKLGQLLSRSFEDESTASWILTAMAKIQSSCEDVNDTFRDSLRRYKISSHNMDIRQRACEFDQLLQDKMLMKEVLPAPTSQTLEIDSTLSFLDEYVSEALSQGVPVYKPKQQRQTHQITMAIKQSLWSGLNFDPYESPTASLASTASKSTPPHKSPMITVALDPSVSSSASGHSSEPWETEDLGSSRLNLKGLKPVWSREGYHGTKQNKDKTRDKEVTEFMDDKPAKSKPTVQVSSVTATATPSKHTATIVETEEERRKRELASAVFSGIVTSEEEGIPDEVENNHGGRTPKQTIFTDSLLEGFGHREVDKNQQGKEASIVDLLSEINFSQDVADTSNVDMLPGIIQTGVSATSVGVTPPDLTPSGQDIDILSKLDNSVNGKRSDLLQDISADAAEVGKTMNMNQSSSHVTEKTEGGSTLQRMGGTDHFISIADESSTDRESVHIESLQGEAMDDTKLTDSDIKSKSGASADLLLTDSGVKPSPVCLLDSDIDDNALSDGVTVTQTLPDGLDQYPHAKEHQELVSDSVVRVSSCKVWKPDVLAIVVFITNQNKFAIQSMQFNVDVPSNLKVAINESECNTFSVDKLEFRQCHVEVLQVGYIGPSLHMVLGGQLLYKDHTNTTKRLFFSTPLHMSDFLRPLKLVTEEFGKKWTSCSKDKKIIVQRGSIQTMEDYMKFVEKKLHLHSVQIIGYEGISCGILLQKSNDICLLHGKFVQSNSLELWFRSNSQLLSDAVARQCSTMFK